MFEISSQFAFVWNEGIISNSHKSNSDIACEVLNIVFQINCKRHVALPEHICYELNGDDHVLTLCPRKQQNGNKKINNYIAEPFFNTDLNMNVALSAFSSEIWILTNYLKKHDQARITLL